MSQDEDLARLKAFCVRDLIETEKKYIDALQLLCDHYRKSLFQFVRENPCTIQQADIELLIPSHVQELFLSLHRNFVASLIPACQQLDEKLDPIPLLELFRDVIPFVIPHYKDHCCGQFERIDMLRQMREDSAFAAEIDRLQAESKSGQTLESEISKLPTRIMRYSLLFADLCRYLEKTAALTQILQANDAVIPAAKARIAKVTNNVNEACRWVAANHINVVLENIDHLPPNLVRPTMKMRADLYEATFSVISSSSSETKEQQQLCKILLFDEGIVLVRPASRNGFLRFVPFPVVATLLVDTVEVKTEGGGTGDEKGETVRFEKVKQTCLLHSAEATGAKAAQLLAEDVNHLNTLQQQGDRRRLPGMLVHRGFPSCSIDKAARIRCAVTFAVLSLFYIYGAATHSHEGREKLGLWNKLANMQLGLFGYFLPFGWVLGAHYQYVIGLQGYDRFWVEFVTDVSSWAHIYLMARFVVEPLANILWPLFTLVGDDKEGAASHAILTLIACGYAMLASDSKWFQRDIFESMLCSANPRHQWIARTLVGSGIYLVVLYCSMAVTTTRYFHTMEEFAAAIAVASVVLGGYVFSFDYLSRQLQFAARTPERQKRTVAFEKRKTKEEKRKKREEEKEKGKEKRERIPLLQIFLAAFASTLVFILILFAFVAVKKHFSGPSFRIFSGFLVFTSPFTACILSLGVGSLILWLCHGDITCTFKAPVGMVAMTSGYFLLSKMMFFLTWNDVPFSWYAVFFGVVACLWQIIDVALVGLQLPNDLHRNLLQDYCYVPPRLVRLSYSVQAIVFSLLPMLYFLFCLQLFAHFYGNLLWMYDTKHMYWVCGPLVLGLVCSYVQTTAPRRRWGRTD